MACPVTRLDSSLASHSAAWAMSSGCPARPSGCTAAKRSVMISSARGNGAESGVTIPPGQMQLTRMPWGPPSAAALRVSEITPALVIP